MDEEKSGKNKKNGSSPTRQRQRPNRDRDSYNNWVTRRGRGGNSSSQQISTDNSSISGHDNRDTANGGPSFLRTSPSNTFGGSTNSGLNMVRDLLDDIDTSVTSPENAGSNESSPESTNNTSNTNTHNNFSRRGLGLRVRRLFSNDEPGRVGPSGGSSNSDAPGRNVSPVRRGRPHPSRGRRIPPLQLPNRDSGPGRNRDNDLSSPEVVSPLSPSGSFGDRPLELPSPRSWLVRGLGTEEEPYELSPGLPDVPSSPSAFAGAGSMMSDEEIARQLQQEEWEAASTHGDDDHVPSFMRGGMFNMFHYPNPRRRPRVFLPPLRRRGDNSSSNDGAGPPQERAERGGGTGLRQAGRGGRPRIPHYNTNPLERLLLMQGAHGNAADELEPLIFNLFQVYSSPDFEIAAILNSGQLGDSDLGDYESLLALAERIGEVSRGMSQTDINKLPTTKHRSSSTSSNDGATAAAAGATAAPGEPPQCNICLTDYESGDQKRILPCKHEFHKDCVDQWLKTNATCPVCRSEVKPKRS